MLTSDSSADLPRIPNKLYFTISEVSKLCGVKDHTLRYWEEEFAEQLPKVDRRNGRRRYQREHILRIRKIRSLLHEHGYTIAGARKVLEEGEQDPGPRQTTGSGQSVETVSELKEIRHLLKLAEEALSDTNL